MGSATYSKNPYWERTVFLYVKENEDLKSSINEKERLKIVLLKKGTIVVTYEGAASYVITAPALLFVNEKDFPYITVKEEISASALYFHPCALNDSLDYVTIRQPKLDSQVASTILQDAVLLSPILGVHEYANRSSFIKLSPAVDQRIRKLMNQIYSELEEQRDGYWPCRSRSYFIELLITISNISDSSKSPIYDEIPGSVTPLLRSILEYINMNYANRITLELLSKEFGLNRNTLNNMFRESMELTPMQYLIELRIHFACSLLTDTELPVTEVALRSGFFDLSHFGRTFKRYMNCSPIVYRNQGNFS